MHPTADTITYRKKFLGNSHYIIPKIVLVEARWLPFSAGEDPLEKFERLPPTII